jgi:hypothetical protein
MALLGLRVADAAERRRGAGRLVVLRTATRSRHPGAGCPARGGGRRSGRRSGSRTVGEAPSAAEASPGASPSAWDDLFQDAPPGCQGDAQKRDFVSAGSGVPPTADGSPDAPPAAWSDDRGWIARWRTAGPTLPDRLPVARAWITAAPSLPLPQCLASIEIRRIAAQHGIAVEIAHRVEEFAP